MYDGMMAETIRLRGHDDHEITGYLARPLGPGPFPGVVVIHHMPGYDSSTQEIVRTFAAHGYNALCPNLHYRALPDGDPGEAARLTREGGGVPDEQCVGDVAGASAVLRSMVNANGKVGVIGYCSGDGLPSLAPKSPRSGHESEPVSSTTGAGESGVISSGAGATRPP